MALYSDQTIKELLDQRLSAIENHFDADAISLLGPIHPALIKLFRDQIEKLRMVDNPKDRLVILLGTPGGSAEVVEKLVDIIRFHYKEVYFVIPDEAMSAGTIFSMSGDKIYMDYSSSLGPIDPQIHNGVAWVPARGYLDGIEELLKRATKKTITNAEIAVWQSQDLAFLNLCEQQSNLTVTLLKKWLVEYKFRDWNKHRTNLDKLGQSVTKKEKEERAESIARDLGNNKTWHSHARRLGIECLKEMRLDIENYSDNADLRKMIRCYNDLLTDYVLEQHLLAFFHSKHYF